MNASEQSNARAGVCELCVCSLKMKCQRQIYQTVVTTRSARLQLLQLQVLERGRNVRLIEEAN